MTPELAIAKVCGMTPLKPEDVQGLLACDALELELLVRAYRDAGTINDRPTWERVLDVLKTVAEFAQPVATIAGAVAAVFAI